MKTVLKCDFCSETMTLDKVEWMAKHEAECTFNPANHQCYTCKHGDAHPYSQESLNMCNKGHNIYDVLDDGKTCDDWEEEE